MTHRNLVRHDRKWGSKRIAPREENLGAELKKSEEEDVKPTTTVLDLCLYHTADEDYSQEKVYKMHRIFGEDVVEDQIILRKSTYTVDGSLAIIMYRVTPGSMKGPFGILTVNLSESGYTCAADDEAFVDTNNNGPEIIDFIIENGIGEPTDRIGMSGFCTYPEFQFNIKDIKDYDPKEEL